MHLWSAFVGSRTPGYHKRKRVARSTAFVALLGGFGAVYFLSELVLQAQIHPVHWLVAGAGALVAYWVGYLWVLRRTYLRYAGQRRTP